jgi:hypothetical protein
MCVNGCKILSQLKNGTKRISIEIATRMVLKLAAFDYFDHTDVDRKGSTFQSAFHCARWWRSAAGIGKHGKSLKCKFAAAAVIKVMCLRWLLNNNVSGHLTCVCVRRANIQFNEETRILKFIHKRAYTKSSLVAERTDVSLVIFSFT